MSVQILGFQVWPPVRRSCPWTSALECAIASERGVAGTSDFIRACPEHESKASLDLPIDAFLAVAQLEGDYLEASTCRDCGKSTEGSEEWSDGLCDDCHLSRFEDDPDRIYDDRMSDA